MINVTRLSSSIFARLMDQLLVSDPGLIRLRNALRSTLACGLTGFIGVAWVLTHQLPLTLAGFGVIFAMISPLFVREISRRIWLTTLASLYACSAATFIAASLLTLAPREWGANTGFFVVLFTGILCQACGPRALGCALLSAVTYYLGLYLHLSLPHLAESLAISLLAPSMVLLTGRWLLPTRPARTLHRAIQTVVRRGEYVVRAIEQERHANHAGKSRMHRCLASTSVSAATASSSSVPLRNALSALNEAALALEEHLSLFGTLESQAQATVGMRLISVIEQLRERLVDVEIAAGRCLGPAPGAGVPATAMPSAVPSIGSQNARVKPAADVRALRKALARLRKSERLWDDHYAATPVGSTATRALSRQAAPVPLRARFTDIRSRLAWRPAIRATLAALLAMALGYELSPERWYWAVVTTFVVFLGTRSRADTLFRGLERVAGTIAGALVSALVATTLHVHPAALIATMVVCVFGWAYFILNSYGRGVFFITTIVGLIYTELGFAIGPLVEIRIEEVLLGCAVAFAVAFVVMPLTATRHIDTRMSALLRALRTNIRSSADTFAHPMHDAGTHQPTATMRALDRGWHDLRIALRPFQTQRVFAWNPAYELAIGSVLACLHSARALTHLAERHGRPSADGRVEDAAAPPGAVASDARSAAASANPGDVSTAAPMSSAVFATVLQRIDTLIAAYDERTPATSRAFAMSTMAVSPDKMADIPRQAAWTADPALAEVIEQLDCALMQLTERMAVASPVPVLLRDMLRTKHA